jgi:hypothetical protein
MSAKKSEIKKAGLDVITLQEKMKKEVLYVPELYEVSEPAEGEEYYTFTLKEEIFRVQLLPFLREIYPVMYRTPQFGQNLVDDLNGKTVTEWLEIAENKSDCEFQMDIYAMSDCIGDYPNRIYVNYNKTIILDLAGKIFMESSGGLFHFFKDVIVKNFSEFSLAGAIRVYITG